MNLRITSFEEYQKEYQRSLENTADFWESKAIGFTWHKKWQNICSGDFSDLKIKWFDKAKLNITENCLDRHLEKYGAKTALIFEPNDPQEKTRSFTFYQLHAEVCRFSNVLKNLGVKKGDVVCLYMAMVPELLIATLACARIGAVHSVVFAGFSPQSLAGRIHDSESQFVITCDEGMRGSKTIPLKSMVDEALLDCPDVKQVIVYQRTGAAISMQAGRDLWWHDLIKNESFENKAEVMEAEDPLFILYTSGSTGKPKGLLHTQAGYMVYAAYSFQNVFQIDPGSEVIYWCTADIGWITGHTYLTYGPLLSATTTVMFEGIPTYPDPGRFWDIVDKHQVTHFYTAPTAIRALESFGLEHVKDRNLTSLKVLGTVGEPINEEAWSWYNTHIGKEKCPIVDTWWQTETGGILISPLAGLTKTKPSYAMLPLPGIKPVLIDEKGKEILTVEAEGILCFKNSWPSIARSIYGNQQRYQETYFSMYPGYYFTGDGALRDKNGNYRITGRVDDVINVSGHRLGTAEIEEALNQHSAIVESAVVGFPHPIKGQGIFAFVICPEKKDEEKIRKEALTLVSKNIGPIAKPDHIVVVDQLPKTRSGKIMRRVLRKLAAGKEDFGDTSTLIDPSVIENITNCVFTMKKKNWNFNGHYFS